MSDKASRLAALAKLKAKKQGTLLVEEQNNSSEEGKLENGDISVSLKLERSGANRWRSH